MANSAEVNGIIRYMMNSGIPFNVTDISTPGIHTTGSYHYRQGTGAVGLAVDLAGPIPSVRSVSLRRIVDVLQPVAPRLAEFLHPWNRADHSDHVHVAVPIGTVLAKEILVVPDDPNLPNITGPVSFHPIFGADGKCTGYYIFSTKTGELHSFGPGAPYYGRSEVIS